VSSIPTPITDERKVRIAKKDDAKWHRLDDPCGHAPDEYDDRGVVTIRIRCDKDDIGNPRIKESKIKDWSTDERPETDDFCNVWYRPDKLCHVS